VYAKLYALQLFDRGDSRDARAAAEVQPVEFSASGGKEVDS
jgi:hypothetical protein